MFIQGELAKGMGGSMDLVAAPHTKVIVCMEHTGKDGSHRIVSNCSLPLTGKQCVDMIITEKVVLALGVTSLLYCFLVLQAVFDVDPEDGLKLVEIAEGVGIEDILTTTGCEFAVAEELRPMGRIKIV